MNGFHVYNAKDGGYIVMRSEQAGYASEILFAGSLDDCLTYIKNKLYNAELTRDREAVS